MIPVDLYFRLEFDQRYIRLDHDILRLDHEFGLNMSRSETSFSVADPATISSSNTLILAMKEIVAQIDSIAIPVPNNSLRCPLSYPVHCLSSPYLNQRAKLSDQVDPPDCWNKIRPAGSMTADRVFEQMMEGIPCSIADSWALPS